MKLPYFLLLCLGTGHHFLQTCEPTNVPPEISSDFRKSTLRLHLLLLGYAATNFALPLKSQT